MQNEINSSPAHKLTGKIVENTLNRADLKYKISGEAASMAAELLVKTWKYGAELGKIMGYSSEKIRSLRKPDSAKSMTEQNDMTFSDRLKRKIRNVFIKPLQDD